MRVAHYDNFAGGTMFQRYNHGYVVTFHASGTAAVTPPAPRQCIKLNTSFVRGIKARLPRHKQPIFLFATPLFKNRAERIPQRFQIFSQVAREFTLLQAHNVRIVIL